MDERRRKASQRPLLSQLRRFVRLRWVAGTAVLVGSLAQAEWLGWYSNARAMACVGAIILFYNLVLRAIMGIFHPPRRQRTGPAWIVRLQPVFSLSALAWAQLLLDLASLTLLALLTGGVHSPLLGFYVFHMVFASLLLPRTLSYAGASLAMAMFAAGLWTTNQWPQRHPETTMAIAWMVMLLTTVWLANGMTVSLRRHRLRLVQKNRRIHAMSQALRRQQQGMIQQEKMAAAGRMAAGVAHEIANPLASMDGLLQLMERRPERARPDALATLREQIGRINQIVRRMTEFAHPGDGQWQTCSLNSLVERAMEVIRFDPRVRRVQVERQFGTDLPPVRVLPDAVHQVLVNLIINALDAMERVESPTLTIRTYRAGGCCAMEVQDNGHGISEEHRKRLFEPFFTTKPVGKGTGLGLSISYSLVQQLGGKIQIESREGHGATFIVRLPQAGQHEPQRVEASASEHPVNGKFS